MGFKLSRIARFLVTLALATIAMPSISGADGNGERRPEPSSKGPNQTFSVCLSATYPGANAVTVANTVAEPIESALKKLANVRNLRSWCTSEGVYFLEIHFEPGAEREATLRTLRDALDLVKPRLPAEVSRTGFKIKQWSGSPVALVIVSALDSQRENLFQSGFLDKILRPGLAQLSGVSEVAGMGLPRLRLRLHVDFDRMRARGISCTALTEAYKNMKLEGDSVSFGDQMKLENTVLKTTAQGQHVLVRDIAVVEIGTSRAFATYDGKPVIALAVHAAPGTSARAVADGVRKELTKLAGAAPAGMQAEIAIDFTRDAELNAQHQLLLVDCEFREGTSAAEVRRRLQKFEETLRRLPAVAATFCATEPLVESPGSPAGILVRHLRATRGDAILQQLRKDDPDTVFHARPWTEMGPKFPVDLALVQTGDGSFVEQEAQLQACLKYLREQEPTLADAFSNFGAVALAAQVDIDKAKAAAIKVAVEEICAALTLREGMGDPETRVTAKELLDLEIRTEKGQDVPLRALVAVREIQSPRIVQRLNGHRIAEIQAVSGRKMEASEIRKLTERIAAAVKLPANYRLVALED